MWSFIKSLFAGSGITSTIESVATEWIQTDKEKAEAQALMVKTLDPNGMMRRNISDRVLQLYSIYIITMLALIVLEFFGLGQINDGISIATATDKIKDLFVPITTMTGGIVGASFGVNGVNAYKGK